MVFMTVLLITNVVIWTWIALSIYCYVALARRLQMMNNQGEILADSMASRLTSNPSALRTALQSLKGLELMGQVRADIAVILRDPRGRRRLSERFVVDQEPEELFEERIANLRRIEDGNWDLLGRGLAASGEPVMPEGWE